MLRYRPFLLVAIVAALLGIKSNSAQAVLPWPTRLDVTCEAVTAADFPPVFGYGFGYGNFARRSPELVVLGTIRVLKKVGVERTFEVTVEKVLYGHTKEKLLTFYGSYYFDDGTRQIVALFPGFYAFEKPYILSHVADPDEEKAMRALGEARLDLHVLGAECIFIGKQIALTGNHDFEVEVIRPLAGPAPGKGERVVVDLGATTRVPSDHRPIVRQEPEIYFTHRIDLDSNRGRTTADGQKQGVIFHASYRQSINREADVLAALKRRDDYPIGINHWFIGPTEAIGPMDKEGILWRHRKVLFRGPTEDAIELLGSANAGAVLLGKERLLHDWPQSRPAIVSAIEQRLLQRHVRDQREHRRLKNLIALLGEVPDRGGNGDMMRLLERHIKAIASHAPEPPEQFDHEGPLGEYGFTNNMRRWLLEQFRDDVNHALSWLVMQQDDVETRHDYGARLLRVRSLAKGRWKAEIDLAIEESKQRPLHRGPIPLPPLP